MADGDYYSGLWPTGEGMRRRQGPCCCCLWISCALLVAWLWQLGIGMGWGSFASSDVDATPAVAFSNLPKSPPLYFTAPLLKIIPLSQLMALCLSVITLVCAFLVLAEIG
jgi:hypothetical protein